MWELRHQNIFPIQIIKMNQITIKLAERDYLVGLGESKEEVVSRIGQPDGDVGNGCCDAWPDVFVYDHYELHFKSNQLFLVKDVSVQAVILQCDDSSK